MIPACSSHRRNNNSGGGDKVGHICRPGRVSRVDHVSQNGKAIIDRMTQFQPPAQQASA